MKPEDVTTPEQMLQLLLDVATPAEHQTLISMLLRAKWLRQCTHCRTLRLWHEGWCTTCGTVALQRRPGQQTLWFDPSLPASGLRPLSPGPVDNPSD